MALSLWQSAQEELKQPLAAYLLPELASRPELSAGRLVALRTTCRSLFVVIPLALSPFLEYSQSYLPPLPDHEAQSIKAFQLYSM